MDIEASNNQLQQQERLIKHLEEEIYELRRINRELNDQFRVVSAQSTNLKKIVSKDPIYMILNGVEAPTRNKVLHVDYDQLQKRLKIYQAKVKELQKKVQNLQKTLLMKQDELMKSQKKLISLEEQLRSLQTSYNLVEKQKDELAKNNNQLITQIQNREKKWLQLAQQINKSKKDYLQRNLRHTQALQIYDRNLQNLMNGWLRTQSFITNFAQWQNQNQSSRVQQLSQKFKKQSTIIEELGKQLDTRNDQVAQTLRNQNLNSELNVVQSDQHSMREMIQSSKFREQRFKQLLEKYKQVKQTLEESIKQKRQLEKQYKLLRHEIQSTRNLHETNRQISEELDKIRSQRDETKRYLEGLVETMESIMEENDIFQQFMRQQYGHKVYQEKINEEVKKYEMRKSEREAHFLWANTSELIEMNKKLKERLSRRH